MWTKAELEKKKKNTEKRDREVMEAGTPQGD